MRHTEQRTQRLLLQELDFDISLGCDCCLFAGPLGALLVSLPLLFGHIVACVLGLANAAVGVAIKKVQPRIGRIGAQAVRGRRLSHKRLEHSARDFRSASPG
jgi:hypothetical protein